MMLEANRGEPKYSNTTCLSGTLSAANFIPTDPRSDTGPRMTSQGTSKHAKLFSVTCNCLELISLRTYYTSLVKTILPIIFSIIIILYSENRLKQTNKQTLPLDKMLIVLTLKYDVKNIYKTVTQLYMLLDYIRL